MVKVLFEMAVLVGQYTNEVVMNGGFQVYIPAKSVQCSITVKYPLTHFSKASPSFVDYVSTPINICKALKN